MTLARMKLYEKRVLIRTSGIRTARGFYRRNIVNVIEKDRAEGRCTFYKIHPIVHSVG